MTDATDERDAPMEVLLACLEDPGGCTEHLPRVVGLLESDDESLRVGAAWALCVVAVENPSTVEYIVRRLCDRFEADEASRELTSALDYLAGRFPEAVEETLAALSSESAEDESLPMPEPGVFTKNHVYGGESGKAGSTGPHLGGVDSDANRSQTPSGKRPGYEETRELDDSSDRESERSPRQPTVESARKSHGEKRDRPSGDDHSETDSAESEGGNSGSIDRRTPDVSSIASRSRFDQLHVLATRERGRYADVHETLVGRRTGERAIALQILHLPEDWGKRPAFESEIRDVLRDWAEVDDHPHVTSLLDWGIDPRPWLATDLAGDSLAEQDRLGLERALADAIDLADALSVIHRSDVVHGGIDPGNVTYPENALESTDRDPPSLTNVGLLHVYRYHRDPTLCLDPRYAAPEYFDTRYGGVDHATDIYQLGAVLVRLVAGRPPFGGTVGEVRTRVLEHDPPAPSEAISGLPERLDDVVAKAMAKQKIARYDAIEHFRQELVGIREEIA